MSNPVQKDHVPTRTIFHRWNVVLKFQDHILTCQVRMQFKMLLKIMLCVLALWHLFQKICSQKNTKTWQGTEVQKEKQCLGTLRVLCPLSFCFDLSQLEAQIQPAAGVIAGSQNWSAGKRLHSNQIVWSIKCFQWPFTQTQNHSCNIIRSWDTASCWHSCYGAKICNWLCVQGKVCMATNFVKAKKYFQVPFIESNTKALYQLEAEIHQFSSGCWGGCHGELWNFGLCM